MPDFESNLLPFTTHDCMVLCIVYILSCRFSRENVIVVALWCSKGKAPAETVLHSLCNEINTLQTEGTCTVNVQISFMCVNILKICTEGIRVSVDEGLEVTCRAKLLFCVADLPAKAVLLNSVQYNGKYGCHTCQHEGEQVWIVPESIGRLFIVYLFDMHMCLDP